MNLLLRFSTILVVAVFLFSCNNNPEVVAKPPPHHSIKRNKINALTEEEKLKKYRLDTLFKSRAINREFNGSVLVAQNGKILYKACFGYSVYEDKTPIKFSTQFQIASTSKPFTATAIMLLKEKGLLNYTDDVKKYFPDFPYSGISIKLLLNHRSGLGNYIYFMENDFPDEGKFISNEMVLNYILKKKPTLYSKPDKKFEYNNTNYVLLALIVEKISGKPFPKFMKEEIFDKCGMKNTWVKTSSDTIFKSNQTIGYFKKEWERYKLNFADGVYGDKNIFSTAVDLYRFENAINDYMLLKKETLAEAYKGYSTEKPGSRNYGFGWRVYQINGDTKFAYHNGWWHGYNSTFFRRLSDHAVIIILANKYNRSAYQIYDVLQVLDNSQNVIDLEQDEQKDVEKK